MAQDTLHAIILRIWPDEPVYHEPGYRGAVRIGDSWYDFTVCGRKVGLYVPWLPKKHVVKFARPCKDCYPQEG